jgi:hypothetical protein
MTDPGALSLWSDDPAGLVGLADQARQAGSKAGRRVRSPNFHGTDDRPVEHRPMRHNVAAMWTLLSRPYRAPGPALQLATSSARDLRRVAV